MDLNQSGILIKFKTKEIKTGTILMIEIDMELIKLQ